MALSKLKALLRKAAERTVDGLWKAIGTILETFKPQECENCFAAGAPDRPSRSRDHRAGGRLALAEVLPSVSEAAPQIETQGSFRYAGKRVGSGSVQGVSASFAEVNKLQMAEGRFVSNLNRGRYFAVVGADVADAMRRRGGRGGAHRRAHPRALAGRRDRAARRLRLRPRGADGLVRGERGGLRLRARPRNRRLVERIDAALAGAEHDACLSGETARRFADFPWTTRKSWSRERRVVAKAEWMPGRGANPRFVVTSLPASQIDARPLYEQLYCARGDIPVRGTGPRAGRRGRGPGGGRDPGSHDARSASGPI